MLIKRKKGLVFRKVNFDEDRNSLSNYLAKQIVLCRLIHTYIRITKSTTYKQTVTAFHEEIELVTGTYNVRNSQLPVVPSYSLMSAVSPFQNNIAFSLVLICWYPQSLLRISAGLILPSMKTNLITLAAIASLTR